MEIKTCAIKGCENTLHFSNRSGFCSSCYQKSPIAKCKKRDYYEANKDRIQRRLRTAPSQSPEESKKRNKKWNATNRDYIYANNLRRYGLTPESKKQIEDAQGGVCAICVSPQNDSRKNRLCVDHCHRTGAVRGLLCSNCNAGLGQFKDNAKFLRKAADYLDKQKLSNTDDCGEDESA